MCVFSPGPIFECHWNLISQRHSEKKEKSPRKSCLSLQLAQTIQPFIGFVVLCVLISKQACVFVFILDALLKLCAVFNVAVWDFFFPPWLCWFEFLCMEWQQDKCTELWRTNRVNCPSQNAKPIIRKMTELQKKKRWKKTGKKREIVCKGRKDGKECELHYRLIKNRTVWHWVGYG